MSEPSSLYLQVHLTPAALEAYKQSAPSLPLAFTDWLPWLATRHFYGTFDEARLAQITYPADITCGAYIADCVESPYAQPTASRYDAATQTWTLIIGMFSENYYDFVEMLSLLRGIIHYKDLPGSDFILLYPYFWADGIDAYLVLDQAASRFQEQVPPAVLAQANAQIKALADALADSFPGEP